MGRGILYRDAYDGAVHRCNMSWPSVKKMYMVWIVLRALRESGRQMKWGIISYPLFADADMGIYPHAGSQYHARPMA